MPQQKITFLGLGAMGYPMAGFLTKNDYQVTVYNRTTAKAEKWTNEYSGEMAKTPERSRQRCRCNNHLCR